VSKTNAQRLNEAHMGMLSQQASARAKQREWAAEKWGRTVGYLSLLDSKSEQQLYEICARSSAAVKEPEPSHEDSQSGPITASTMSSRRMRLIATMACVASQSISSHLYDSLTRNLSFASATAIAIAPADERPSAQELAVGNSTAKCSAAQAALVRSREGGRARLGKSQPSSRKGGLNRPGHW
jgi:hypothetical protein